MVLRPIQVGDIQACGKVMYEAFTDIAERHNFPPDFPNQAVVEGLLSDLLNAPGFDAFAAEEEGRILGSIFVSRRSRVGGISVLTIDPKAQNRGIGERSQGGAADDPYGYAAFGSGKRSLLAGRPVLNRTCRWVSQSKEMQ